MAFEHGLNITVTRKHRDGATCAMPLREELLNNTGVLHGASALMKNDPPMLARNDPGARQTTMKWNARSPEETLPDLQAVVLSGSARGETATSLR